MSDPTCPTPDELSFGEGLAELDQVVGALESGQLELEDSLVRYQRGVALLRALQGKLADAQQQVSMLIGELESESSEETAPADASAKETGSSDPTEIPF